MPISSTPTACVSGGSGVEDGEGVAVGDLLGAGVGAAEQAASITTAMPASQRTADGG
jgi:hypothetical protein